MIKELQDELKRIKKFYQMFGKDGEVMDEAIERLEDCKADGVIFEYFGRKYVADSVKLKAIDSNGVCNFYGFKEVKEDE